jgi:acetyl-CoA carboxylase beta subunit
MEGNVLQTMMKSGKLMVKDGWLKCPSCRKRLLRVEQSTAAKNLIVFCRNCKRTVTVDIDRGQCFESQSPT